MIRRASGLQLDVPVEEVEICASMAPDAFPIWGSGLSEAPVFRTGHHMVTTRRAVRVRIRLGNDSGNSSGHRRYAWAAGRPWLRTIRSRRQNYARTRKAPPSNPSGSLALSRLSFFGHLPSTFRMGPCRTLGRGNPSASGSCAAVTRTPRLRSGRQRRMSRAQA